MPLRTRQRLAAALGFGVAVSGLQFVASPLASATPAGTGLVINEVYGGGGNSGAAYTFDFIEIYNPSASPISVGGLSLQYRAATGSGAPGSANVFALPDKTVQPGDFFLVQAAGGATVTDKPLPATPDAQTTGTVLNLSGTGGQIYLASGTAPLDPGTGIISKSSVVDFVGWGTTAASYEGAPVSPAVRNSAPPTANATSISRTALGVDTDSNSADFASATTPSPTASSAAATLAVTDPQDKSATVGTAVAPLELTATGGTSPYTWEASGLPAGLSLSGGIISGTPTTAGAFEVTLTATDSARPTAAIDTETFTWTVNASPITPIAQIQGDDASSPYVGTTQVTQGVVTAIYRDGGFNGMFIQTPGGDTEGASDGLFVFGGNGFANIPGTVAEGDSVEVTGEVSEVAGSTQIVPDPGGVTELENSLGAVTPRAIAYPTTEAAREAREGELLAPTDTFTVSNTYNVNTFAEIGLATGSNPLKQPTEFVRDDDTAGLQAIKDENAARTVALDDGSSLNYLTNATAKNQPLPWLSPANPIRVGAKATLVGPVVLDWRNNAWKFQPTQQVTDEGADVVTFENTRIGNETPSEVGGDLRIATFNVLNYFDTTGEQYILNGDEQDPPVDTRCTYYVDRANNRIGNNRCGVGPDASNGPRGAATADSLKRQESKIVTAINALDADIVALEEIENSMKLVGETDRDGALARLVELLNQAAGQGTWDFVASPAEALVAAAVDEQDVIRSGFMYQPARVAPVGESDILFGTTEFANAREPLAQAFKARGGRSSDAFAVIANHFKSKGDSDPVATGDNATSVDTGAFNGDRTRQAAKLVEFADEFAKKRRTEAVFLAGDFNSYSQEDPMHVLYGSGYDGIDSDSPGEDTYSFNGLSGSLDHILGNEAAMGMVTGADIWDINASESTAFQYSRFNYNATQFFNGSDPFATSDHNPEIVGIDVPDAGQQSGLVADDVTITWGETASLDVTASGNDGTPTGTVEWFEGETSLGHATLTDGTAALTLAAGSMEPGTHALVAVYAGDGTYGESTDDLVLTVAKATPAISAGGVSVDYGEAATVRVVLDPDATGTVVLTDGDRVIDSSLVIGGMAALTLPAKSLEPGLTTLTASYSGDGHFDSASTGVAVDVAKAMSVISAGNVSVGFGEAATVQVTLNADATGTVVLTDGDRVIDSSLVTGGIATLNLPAKSLEPGLTTLTASYSGDGHFDSASTGVVVDVAKATSAISASGVSVGYGKAATVRVVLDPDATGTVVLKAGARVIDSSPVTRGIATMTLPAKSLKPGQTTLTAAYSGDRHFEPASTTLRASVAKATSKTRTVLKPRKVVLKKTRASVVVKVAGSHGVKATGKVKIKVTGQRTRTVTLRNGSVSVKLGKFTSKGKKTITVTYLGDGLLKTSTSKATFKVVRR